MKRVLSVIPKNGNGGGLTPLTLEHGLQFLLGIVLIAFGHQWYEMAPSVLKVIYLIVFLGSLVGLAPLPIPVFRRNFTQVGYCGLSSGLLDSYIVLDGMKSMRTVEQGQQEDAVRQLTNDQPTDGVRAKFMALCTIAALIGGLIIWFGEVFAAGVYMNDARMDIRSALFIFPPVLLFLSILGIHAELLPIRVVPNETVRFRWRDLTEFGVGISLLLFFSHHNPLWCMGCLLVYAVCTRQGDQLMTVWRHHTEMNVMLVLFIALFAGPWLLMNAIEPLRLHKGAYLPIIPAGIQAVLWGPLYEDPTVHFWMRVTTVSTGALLIPTGSLVGVMLFKTKIQWWAYMRYSIPYAVLWYIIMRIWIYVALESPVGQFLEQWAHAGGHH